MKIQLIELYSLQDLLALSKHFLFRMDFDNLGMSIYYSGVTGDSFIGLNVFISKEKYSGNTTINDRGDIVTKNRMTTTTVNIISVKTDTLLRGIFANYIVANFAFEKKYDILTKQASNILSELKVEHLKRKSKKEIVKNIPKKD